MNIAGLLLLYQLQTNSDWTAAGADSVNSGTPGQEDMFALLLQAALQQASGSQGLPGGGGQEGKTAGFAAGIGQSGSGLGLSTEQSAAEIKGSQGIDPLIVAASRRYGVDPALIRQVVQAESGYDPQAVSPVGAAGLMQLMPGTAEAYGVSNVLDPAQNINGGTHFLRDLLQRYQGNVPLALAAYNAGPGAVDKYQGIPPYAETQGYVQKILAGLGGLDQKA